ncbi:hypothetical protein GOBAR_DD21734 [Gossypium barbadense]|nr:hypothetical protein GOBAR_DD21734 [Gossypium barbadense]
MEKVKSKDAVLERVRTSLLEVATPATISKGEEVKLPEDNVTILKAKSTQGVGSLMMSRHYGVGVTALAFDEKKLVNGILQSNKPQIRV